MRAGIHAVGLLRKGSNAEVAESAKCFKPRSAGHRTVAVSFIGVAAVRVDFARGAQSNDNRLRLTPKPCNETPQSLSAASASKILQGPVAIGKTLSRPAELAHRVLCGAHHDRSR